MTLYLSPELTPDEIRKAKKAGIVGMIPSLIALQRMLDHLIGVKSYPRGVTTNSDGGIESYEPYYPVFETMQEVDMVLNLHGEVHSDAAAVSSSQKASQLANICCFLEYPCAQRRAFLPATPLQAACRISQATYCT